MEKSLILTQLLLLTYFSIGLGHRKDFIDFTERDSRFISFNSDDGKIDIDLDLSIPFISIPMSEKADEHGVRPLVNINSKSVAIASVLTLITAVVVPLLFKTPVPSKYRSDDGSSIWDAGKTFKELILGNNYVTPCIQKAICESIGRIDKKKEATATDKIVDGLSNLNWMKNLINGTSIEEAFELARSGNCVNYNEKCRMSSDLFDVVMNELGL